MKGFGTAHFGTAFFGYGEPDTINPPPANLPAAVYIDPNNNDTVLNADGTLQSMPSTRQRVYLSLKTELGSATGLDTFGSNLRSLGKIDSTYQARATAAIQTALNPLVVDNSITITGITVSSQSGRVLINVAYIDLLSQAPDNASLVF